jgi:hypothetical protein
MHGLHTTVWIFNVFGLFFILGAHEHYSIDVFVAFYITSRLFLYYHSLANNKVLFQRDHKRVKIWFPLFSYFESNIHSIVPNEYQCPPNIFYYAYRFVKKLTKRLIGTKRKHTVSQQQHYHITQTQSNNSNNSSSHTSYENKQQQEASVQATLDKSE